MKTLRKFVTGRAALVALVLLLGGYVGWSTVNNVAGKQSAETTSEELATPLASLCITDRAAAERAGADCAQALTIARGADGQQGEPGRGITGTTINQAGRLLVTYSDGSTVDVGVVVGQAGPGGRGIASTVLEAGHLILVFSDGTRTDVGRIVGIDGRGIASVGQADGRLIITYTDGTTSDAGPLPQGPPGADGQRGSDGAAGPACPTGYEPVETGPVTGQDGKRYAKSVTCVDPASAVPADPLDLGGTP